MPTGKSIRDIDPGLKQWATDTQKKYLDSVNQHGSIRNAAKACGTNDSTVCRALLALKKKAAMHGYSPEHDKIGRAHV